MSMRRYVLRRIPQLIPLCIFAIVINFTLMHLAPGSPIDYLVGGGEVVPREYIERLTREFGLDKPLHEQLLIYIMNVFRGNLGTSYRYRAPVLQVILERVPNTLLLMTTSIIFAFILGIFLGVSSSKRPYSLLDNLASTISVLGYSIPTFWLGMLLIIVFSVYLRWLPTMGMSTMGAELEGWDAVMDTLKHLILPAATLGTTYLALYTRLTRASMLEELRKDYITTAWGKGLDDRAVYYRHAFRNAMLPVITVLGLNLGLMLTGATLTETVFSWPGIGRLVYDSIITRDYPVLMGIFIIVSITVVLANFIVDILYAILDPRVRYK